MKKQILALGMLFTLILFGMTACTGDQNAHSKSEADFLQVEINDDNVNDFAGKIPNDHAFQKISLFEASTWQDYDNFYRHELENSRGADYFENLQWASISQMILFEKFLTEASDEQKLFYLDEIFSRSYINQPEVSLLLLESLQDVLTEGEIAEYARNTRQLNEDHLSPENFERHLDRNKRVYIGINKLGWTRHGVPK